MYHTHFTMTDKASIRNIIKEENKRHNPDEKAILSQEIQALLLKEEHVIAASTIVLYWSLKNEVDTHTLIPELIKTKNVIILTQSADTAPVIPPEEDTVILVPAMAFDSNGGRLGRGKGHYDRMLATLPHAYTIGICFPWQLINEVPMDIHDVKVKKVITNHNS